MGKYIAMAILHVIFVYTPDCSLGYQHLNF